MSGSHLLFAGTECKGVAIPKGDYPDGPASPPCPMDTVGLRRYDRVTKNWDVVTSFPGSLLGDATSVAVVAETGSTIVVVAFHVVGSHEVGVALQYDAVAQRWAAVPEPRQPIGRSCWVDGALVSLHRDVVDKRYLHARLEVWRPGDAAWSETEPSVRFDSQERPRLLCTAHHAVIDSGPVVGRRGRIAAYSPETDNWTELPAKPVTVPAWGLAQGGDRLAIWNNPPPQGADDHVYAIDLGAATPAWADLGALPVDSDQLYFSRTENATTRVFGATPDVYVSADLHAS